MQKRLQFFFKIKLEINESQEILEKIFHALD